MAAVTPRRSSRIPHTHTPKMSERKKTLFVAETPPKQESLTKHRRLSVVDSESDSDDCDLGIISTLDSSSCDENDPSVPKTPERSIWHGTRSQSRRLNQSTDLKNFMKSPFTLKKYQTRYSCPEGRLDSSSTPVTPHFQNHPGTPSSTHSCTSVHTTSSTSSRARKSLASLIADTESCSSSLKDLNFDTDSGSDSKENTPSKSLRRSKRSQKMTPKLQSFKGILMEQKKNNSPMKTAVVCLTKMDLSHLSPSQMMKTPHNTMEAKASPPKLSHRRSAIEVQESPESVCGSEKSHKRLHYDEKSDSGPVSKYPRIDPSTAPKARLSLFNSERLKEILSAKSFYGKTNPELNTNISTKISHAIQATTTHKHRPFSHANRRKRKPGEINMGVRHKIRKPKALKKPIMKTTSTLNKSVVSNTTTVSNKDTSMVQNSSQEMDHDKTDPFDSEKQTIEALLSQWTEEEVPESELVHTKELPCFNKAVIEETSSIFQPVIAVPVNSTLPQDEAVIVEIGAQNTQIPTTSAVIPMNSTLIPQNSTLVPLNSTQITLSSTPIPLNSTPIPLNSTPIALTTTSLPVNSPQISSSDAKSTDIAMEAESHTGSHGIMPQGQFLPVEGGYIMVDGIQAPAQQEIPDLDEIEREIRMLDEQILKIAESNNINAEAVLASTDTQPVNIEQDNTAKLFPIFSKPNPGISNTSTKESSEKGKKKLLKTGLDQYVIDAGQKKFGATQCNECGVIYQIGDPQDEHDHLVHHHATDVLRFNGLKDEYIVEQTPTGRIIRIRGGEAGWKKVVSVLDRVVHPQLGYSSLNDVHMYTAYLYIEKKQIIGCLIVEPKARAYKLLPGDPDCCTVEDYPVKCGVSRIWTHAKFRRRGVAVRMLECARASFLYGQAFTRQEVAFSSPTPAGKALATKYCGTENFYVYIN